MTTRDAIEKLRRPFDSNEKNELAGFTQGVNSTIDAVLSLEAPAPAGDRAEALEALDRMIVDHQDPNAEGINYDDYYLVRATLQPTVAKVEGLDRALAALPNLRHYYEFDSLMEIIIEAAKRWAKMQGETNAG